MPSGISTIAALTPIVASNAVFSVRRASRGAEAMDENPVYGAMNIDIAAGQVLKGVRAMNEIASMSNAQSAATLNGAKEAIKNLSKTSKIMNTTAKVVKFTADNINPIICLTSGVKVLGSEDKLDTGITEAMALTSMFTAEKCAKEFLGLSRKKLINGKKVAVVGNAGYEKLFKKEQLNAITDFCSTKKLFNKFSLEMLPGTVKGLAFVSASILGYKLGTVVARALLGKEEQGAA